MLRWWGAEEKESAATWNSNRESYLTNHPLWWMVVHSKKAFSSLCQHQGVHHFVLEEEPLTTTNPSGCCPLFTQSKFTVMADLGQRFKEHLARGVQCLLAWQRDGFIITCLWCSPWKLPYYPSTETCSSDSGLSDQPRVEELLLICQELFSLADLFSVCHFVLKSELWFFSASTSGGKRSAAAFTEVSNHCFTRCGYLLLGFTINPYSCFGCIMLNICSSCLRALVERLNPRALYPFF